MIARLSPMLAAQAEVFDSDDHLFEVKWDGVRALVAVEAGQWRAWGRELSDYTHRYPELEMVRGLPEGAVLDGELVVLRPALPATLPNTGPAESRADGSTL